MSSVSHAVHLVAAIATTLVLAAAPLAAQSGGAARCPAGSTVPVASASGMRIREVRIVSAPPLALGGFNAPFHVTTRDGTIRQRLLMAAGDTVDTLRVSEALRRINRLQFLTGAEISASCASEGNVDLVVATRDAWSMQPRVRLRSASSAVVGIEESNLLGTGRGARAYLREDPGQLAAGVAYSDPSLFGTAMSTTLYRDAFRDGAAWGAIASTRDISAFERTSIVALVSQSARQSSLPASSGMTGDTVRRAIGSVLLARRISLSASGGTFLQFGAEGERTLLAANSDLPLVGPASVRRSFVGADIGVARRTLRYTNVAWLAAPSARHDTLVADAAEVPTGWSADAVVALGKDFAVRRPAAHLDAWARRVWALGDDGERGPARVLVVGDVWASGYRALAAHPAEWNGGSLRTSIALASPATRGLWTARFAAERLLDPDPDMRSLAMSDPVLRAFPSASRLAESTVSGSVERSRHFADVPGGYVLGGVLFAAASMRWDPAVRNTPAAVAGPMPHFGVAPATIGMPDGDRLYAGSLGAGLLLTPHRFIRSAIRIDVGFPVLRSPQIARRPYLSFSLVPSLGNGRQRTGAP